MVVHNLLLKLHEQSPENINKVQAILLTLQSTVGQIRQLKVEADIRRTASSYDIALLAKFDTIDDFQAYLSHPAHLEVGQRLKDSIAATASVCFAE